MANYNFIDQISSEKPILIAGQTASGKSKLALQIAEKRDSVIINADAIQVFENWRILTARPSTAEENEVKASRTVKGTFQGRGKKFGS